MALQVTLALWESVDRSIQQAMGVCCRDLAVMMIDERVPQVCCPPALRVGQCALTSTRCFQVDPPHHPGPFDYGFVVLQ